MPPGDDKSRIEELKKSLYSRTAPDVRTRRKLRFGDVTTDVKPDWDRPPEEAGSPVLNKNYEDHSMSFFTKLLIGSVLFFIVAVGIGAYLLLNGSNLISGNNIDISVNAPVSVAGGTPVSFEITVTNNNSVPLQLADLSVDFPSGATDPKNPSSELSTYRELIGDIPPGGNAKRTVQAIIFGEENTQKQIAVGVTYKVTGSSSLFNKTKTYDVLVNSSPVTVTASSFSEITSGQEFDLTLHVKSNSQDTLKNVLVVGSYPFGFAFISSSIKPSPDNSTWRLGDIPPGRESVITIHGKLTGENQDTRVFRFSVGAQSSRNQNVIGTEYTSVTQEIAVKKPFMTVVISLDNDQTTRDATGQFNQPVRVDVSWFNNLPTTVSDAEIVMKLSGTAYDKTLVSPGSGYFRSSTDEIVWNQQTVPQLASVGAGESGIVSFTVTPRDLGTPARPLINPVLTFSTSVTGKRTQESGVPESLTSIAVRNDHISTVVTLSGQVVRSTGPFVNTGPIPPKVDLSTTYTIKWTVDNTANVADNVQVRAKLPAGVKWMNAISPASEDVSFDAGSGLISWNVGTVGTYTANSGQRRELSFQVSIQPNVTQINLVPTLVNDASLTGTDDFTGVGLTSVQSYLTTRFSTDPTYTDGSEMVVK